MGYICAGPRLSIAIIKARGARRNLRSIKRHRLPPVGLALSGGRPPVLPQRVSINPPSRNFDLLRLFSPVRTRNFVIKSRSEGSLLVGSVFLCAPRSRVELVKLRCRDKANEKCRG